jgi:hypothetical protein
MGLEIQVNVGGLEKLRKAVLANPALGRAIAHAWELVYRSFTRLRFAKFSKGGGDWAPLKPSTLKRRRGGGGNAAILRDTGAMFASLQPTTDSGSILQSTALPFGLRMDLEGAKSYANGPTLAEVATYHHKGGGRLPAREILVKPDQKTIESMASHAKRIVVKHANAR